ncbi:MAG TPA: carbohydrate binding domain-containing protein [Chloroflexota bacterium]|nr:carbohydrate binding domain-containing protein [Chloroflexota bacterium]
MSGRSSFSITTIGMVIVMTTMAACGPSSSSPTATPTPTFPKAQPGHVIVNPTNAQAFMYLPRSTVQEANGNILIADSGNWDRSGAKIVELSPSGKPVWLYEGGMVFPHAAYPVGSNDILISDTGNDRVFEINRQGKTIWDSDNLGTGKGSLGQGTLSNGAKLLYPNDAVMTSNGDILISSRFSNSVYEINKSGHVDWSCSRFMFRQHNPRLLPNGNLIVADSDDGRVLIINHACTKIRFHYGSGSLVWPRSFQPYPGGNFVIGDSLNERIIEINRQKKILQHWDNLPAPFYVTVLANGNLLTQDSNIHGAIELSPSGGIVQKFGTTDPVHHPTAVVNPGFENTGPKGWLQGDLLTETLPAGQRADMTFDTSNPHSGSSSGRISWPTNTGHLGLYWFQTLSVTPGRTYNFSGWIKTQNVTTCNGCDYGPGTQPGGNAYFYATYSDPSSPYNPPTPSVGLTSNPVNGTTAWTHVTSSFTVPSGVTELQLECRLDGRGTVWFDDVTVT